MIYIAYGVINRKTAPRYYIHDIDGYFDGYFEDSWMKNDIAKRAISEIDKSELIAPKVIESQYSARYHIPGFQAGQR